MSYRFNPFTGTFDNVLGSSGCPSYTSIEANNADTLPDLTAKEVFSYTSVDDKTYVTNLNITASGAVIVTIKINSVIKQVLRTSPSERNVTAWFTNPRNLTTGDVITVELQVSNQFNQTPIDTFVSMDARII